MPTEAKTGTDSVSTAGKTRATRKAAAKPETKPGPEPVPLADHSGNGIIQVSRPDGSQVSLDGDDPDFDKKADAIRSGKVDH